MAKSVAPKPLPSIPFDRPVLGKDLDTLQAKLNVGAGRCSTLLGLTMVVWSQLKSQPETPIPNPTIALLVRLLDAYPQIIKPAPSPQDLHDLIEKKLGRKLQMKHLSVLLGRERSAGSRWLSGQKAPTATVTALLTALTEAFERWPKGALCHYTELVGLEAQLRGIDNVWEEASWTGDPDPGTQTRAANRRQTRNNVRAETLP